MFPVLDSRPNLEPHLRTIRDYSEEGPRARMLRDNVSGNIRKAIIASGDLIDANPAGTMNIRPGRPNVRCAGHEGPEHIPFGRDSVLGLNHTHEWEFSDP